MQLIPGKYKHRGVEFVAQKITGQGLLILNNCSSLHLFINEYDLTVDFAYVASSSSPNFGMGMHTASASPQELSLFFSHCPIMGQAVALEAAGDESHYMLMQAS